MAAVAEQGGGASDPRPHIAAATSLCQLRSQSLPQAADGNFERGTDRRSPRNQAESQASSTAISKQAGEADDPFAAFSEWTGEADEKAYGNL